VASKLKRLAGGQGVEPKERVARLAGVGMAKPGRKGRWFGGVGRWIWPSVRELSVRELRQAIRARGSMSGEKSAQAGGGAEEGPAAGRVAGSWGVVGRRFRGDSLRGRWREKFLTQLGMLDQ
jgi:hypothetical protein